MGGCLHSQILNLVGCTALFVYLAGVPLLMLLYGSIRSAPSGDPGASYTIQNCVKAYFDRHCYRLCLNSVYSALDTCGLAFLIGTFLGRVSERILSPISWILLLSPKSGLIDIVLYPLALTAFKNSFYLSVGSATLVMLLTSILLYSYNSTVLSIMAFDLWEGGQSTYVCALGVMMVLLSAAMAGVARQLGARIGLRHKSF